MVLKRRGPEMCTLGVLGLSCEAPAAGEHPNLGHTHENLEHHHNTTTPQHHNTTTQHTTHNTQHTSPHNLRREVLGRVVWGKGSPAGVDGPKNKNMSNKLSRRAAPLAKDGLQRFGPKRFDQKKSRGQKWFRVFKVASKV